ncbi:MAG: hypothetical protein RMK91_08570 [Pseudanabaenaceae cyanobacterium SKYGB_i_bin29]|nr:hypothetical protein [Pseudanabaenaceae cyanobacterium SKYG29]MDW8421908.1 hypothetical protein [Pseudanabaenaceae cyanobacterium SKYGB_i_bin29]
MTKKTLTDMVKEEVAKEAQAEAVEGKVVRRHTKADLEAELARLTQALEEMKAERDRLQTQLQAAKVELQTAQTERHLLQEQLQVANTEREQLQAQVSQLTQALQLKQAHLEQLQTYLEQAQGELKAKAEALPALKKQGRIIPRPIGSNRDLQKQADQNIGWFD